MGNSRKGNSRKGKKLSSAACDLCRLRKVQCNFVEADGRCTRCLTAGVDCTFLRGHRPRGRVSRHAAAAREQTQSARDLSVASDVSTATTSGADGVAGDRLVPDLGVAHLCPLPCMARILADFGDYLYPVLPVVHVPTLMTAVDRPLHIHEPCNRQLFQTVMAVAAATVASMPRRFAAYNSNGQYGSVQAMVDRATWLVHMSRRMSRTPLDDDDDDASLASCVVSVVLSVAASYTGRTTASRTLMSEAIVQFRALQLYRRPSHASLTGSESEIGKRLFWMLYIGQIHDRIDSVVPHYAFCFDPSETDWAFLMPRATEDALHFYASAPAGQSPGLDVDIDGAAATHRPTVSGFCALLRVYLCVVDAFAADFPRPPQSVLTAKPLSMEPRAMPRVPSSDHDVPATADTRCGLFRATRLTLASITRLVRRFESTMAPLPAVLPVDAGPSVHVLSRSTMQRLIMAANIRMTCLFVQSTTLEMFAAQVERQRAAVPSWGGCAVDANIWELRERFASQTLAILRQFPQEALEANGLSLIRKARKIAATLLERDETYDTLSAAAAVRMDGYVEQFVRALASLDSMCPNLGR